MKRGLVLVEGQTEERFVNECLAPYLEAKGLIVSPTIVKTKRVMGGAHFNYRSHPHRLPTFRWLARRARGDRRRHRIADRDDQASLP